MTTARTGSATVTLDDAALFAALDRVSDGAASRFAARADGILSGIATTARPRWPHMTGLSQRSFKTETRFKSTEIATSLLNDAAQNGRPYSYKTNWSVRTKASLDAEADRVSQRGLTPESAAKIRDHWRARLTRRHGEGAPSEDLAGKNCWAMLVRAPARREMTRQLPDFQQDLSRLAKTGGA